MNKKRVLKAGKLVAIILFFALLLSYIATSVSLIVLIRDSKRYILEKSPTLQDSESLLYQYYCRQSTYNSTVDSAQTRWFYIYRPKGFTKGVMYVCYTIEAYDSKGNLLYGCDKNWAKWEVELKNMKWVVNDIYEPVNPTKDWKW